MASLRSGFAAQQPPSMSYLQAHCSDSRHREGLRFWLELADRCVAGMQGVLVRRKYALTPGQLFRVCWEREKVLVSRNLFLYGFRCGSCLTLLDSHCTVL